MDHTITPPQEAHQSTFSLVPAEPGDIPRLAHIHVIACLPDNAFNLYFPTPQEFELRVKEMLQARLASRAGRTSKPLRKRPASLPAGRRGTPQATPRSESATKRRQLPPLPPRPTSTTPGHQKKKWARRLGKVNLTSPRDSLPTSEKTRIGGWQKSHADDGTYCAWLCSPNLLTSGGALGLPWSGTAVT